MIEFLRIRELALIDDLELEFTVGLNALTGETGAGKSFIMRAVGFLTGEKLEVDTVRPGREKAVVEAVFSLDGEELVMRRELSAETGRSRIFINDSLSSKEAVERLRPRLVLNVSQHGRQRLLQPSWQAGLVDSFLHDPDILAERDRLLDQARGIARQRRELVERAAGLKDKHGLLTFQKDEIDKVGPEPGEEEELLSRQREIKERARTAESVDKLLALMHGDSGSGLLDMLREFSREAHRLAVGAPDYRKDAEGLEDFLAVITDLDSRLRREAPEAAGLDMERIEARLFELAKLKRKLGRSIEEVVELRREIEESLGLGDSLNLDLKRLDAEEKRSAVALADCVKRLNASRRKAANELAGRLASELRGLGFPSGALVEFDFDRNEIYPGVFEDRPRVIWIPNPGQKPLPLDRIASGGELSRFLLAAVALMARENLPTLIFDEVDTGVGGLALNRVGERLAELARGQQVLLITHWPQLAVLAGRHFHVSKEIKDDETRISCRALAPGEVRDELSRMAGGGSRGAAMARELLPD